MKGINAVKGKEEMHESALIKGPGIFSGSKHGTLLLQ